MQRGGTWLALNAKSVRAGTNGEERGRNYRLRGVGGPLPLPLLPQLKVACDYPKSEGRRAGQPG